MCHLFGIKFTLKILINLNPPVLKIFNSDDKLTDPSKDGVGVVLLSGNQPIAFTIAALSTNKQSWAQIEKEMFAIQFACVNFHYYIYGRHVLVNSDDKPLESIFKKCINKISARLQKNPLKVLFRK